MTDAKMKLAKLINVVFVIQFSSKRNVNLYTVKCISFEYHIIIVVKKTIRLRSRILFLNFFILFILVTLLNTRSCAF